jgi:hypothetical protein
MDARMLAALATLATAVGLGIVALEHPTAVQPTCPATGVAQRPLLQKAPASTATTATTGVAPGATPGATAGFRAAGLTINTPVHTGADPAAHDDFGVELAFFGTLARTSLAIEYRHEAGGMLELDSEASRLERFTDDRGTDLANEDSPFGPFDTMARVSEDGRHLVFVVPSDALPAAGATGVSAAGVLAVRCGSQQEDVTSEPVALRAGAAFTVGGYRLTIRDVGPSQWGEGHALTLESRTELAAIDGWALVLPDGSEVAASPSMSMSGMGSWQQTLELDEPVERASLRITRWTDLRTVEVPFEVSAGFGLR